jgi:YbgC/YbaW family acyl-CoA thioester hydrolase
MQSLSPFVWRRRIGMRDVDAWKIVWYGNYFGFCDEARSELLRAFGIPPSEFDKQGYLAVVVDVKSRYHASARFDEEIDIHVRLARVRGSKLTFAFVVRSTADQAVLARIETVMVLLRPNGDLVYLMPETLRASIEAILREQPTVEE